MELSFANPWMLALIWLAPLVGVWWIAVGRQRQRRLARFIAPAMQKRLLPEPSAARFTWQAVLTALGIGLGLFAAARPRWGESEQAVFRRGRDVVIALDVSRSMLADDVYPNRLGRAKVDLMDLVADLEGDRAALIAFRHKANVLCPLTTDYGYLTQALEGISVDSAPRGETDIGDAIRKALDAFENTDPSHKAIILVSDGEDLTGKAVEAAEEAAERGIPIFTIGLGNTRGSQIPGTGTGGIAHFEGEPVITRLQNEALDQIARISGGAYVPVGTASTAGTTLGELYRRRLAGILAKDIEETLQRRHIERYQFFLAPAFLCLVAATLLSRGRLARGRAPSPASPAPAQPPLKDMTPEPQPLKNISGGVGLWILLSMGLTASALGQVTGAVPIGAVDTEPADTNWVAASTNRLEIPPGRSGARIAQGRFRRGDYIGAAEAYLTAAEQSTRESQRDFQYNAALAYLAADKVEDAIPILQRLVHARRDVDVAAARALGTALYRHADTYKDDVDAASLALREDALRRAAGAFQEALNATECLATRHDLQLVLNALPLAEEKAKIARLMQTHGQTDAFTMVNTLLTTQRDLNTRIRDAFARDNPNQVYALEQLATRQEQAADLWIPLKGKLVEQLQQVPENQAAAVLSAVEQTRDTMRESSAALRDLDGAAYGHAVTAEGNVYALWKMMADYRAVLAEDIRRQSNGVSQSTQAVASNQPLPPESARDQGEALDLTHAFLARLPPPTQPTPAPGTNTMASSPAPQGIDPELHSNIVHLASQATEAQEAAIHHVAAQRSADALEQQARSLMLLEEIQELLPQEQQQQQEEQQDQKQQPQEQPQQQPPPPQDPPQAPQDQQDQNQQQPAPPEPREIPEEQLEQLLQKAMEREQEYKERQKERNRTIQLPQNARDW